MICNTANATRKQVRNSTLKYENSPMINKLAYFILKSSYISIRIFSDIN